MKNSQILLFALFAIISSSFARPEAFADAFAEPGAEPEAEAEPEPEALAEPEPEALADAVAEPQPEPAPYPSKILYSFDVASHTIVFYKTVWPH